MFCNRIVLFFSLFLSLTVSAQEEYSYLWSHQYPALANPQIICCDDFVGDSEDDDFNGSLLLQLEGLLNIDAQEIMDNQIINNELARVWRWDVFPKGDGPVQMSILDAEVKTPGLSLEGRMNGITEVAINPSPLSVFTGQISGGQLTMESDYAIGIFYNPVISSFDVSQLPFNIEIPLQQAKISGQFIKDGKNCHGLCGATLKGTDPQILGAVEVSGLIHVGDEINATNQIVSNCACAGISPNTGLLSYSDEGDSLQVMCQYSSGELTPDMCGAEFTHCQNVDQMCSFAAINASFYDVDTNENGSPDSKSVGGLMGVSGAIYLGLIDFIYQNGFE